MRVRLAINLLALGVDADRDERVSHDELDGRIEDLFAVIKRHDVVTAPGSPSRIVLEGQQIVDDHMLRADLAYTFARPVRELHVTSTLDAVTTPAPVHHVRAEVGGEPRQARLSPDSRTVTFFVGGISIRRAALVLLAFAGIGSTIALRVVSRRRVTPNAGGDRDPR